LAERANDALDLNTPLSRMTGISCFLPERHLDVGHVHATAAKIDTKLEERVVAAL
jgi:hypothetical protein